MIKKPLKPGKELRYRVPVRSKANIRGIPTAAESVVALGAASVTDVVPGAVVNEVCCVTAISIDGDAMSDCYCG